MKGEQWGRQEIILRSYRCFSEYEGSGLGQCSFHQSLNKQLLSSPSGEKVREIKFYHPQTKEQILTQSHRTKLWSPANQEMTQAGPGQ